MARLSNISNALKDTKTRTIIIVVMIIVLIGIGIGWFGLKRTQEKTLPTGASVARAPGIESIPGVGTPSREYVKTQEQENVLRAQQAAREGTSSIPTITRTTYTGPSEFTQPGVPGANSAASSADCSPEALARARQSGVKAEELRCKGCDAAALRAAGYTAGELMNAGFSAQELKNAGFTAAELREAGFTAAELARAGFSPTELAAAGYSVAELLQAGISADQLAAAGITSQQLAAAGIGATAGAGKLPKDCSVEKLKEARAQGVTAAALRKMGCGVAALKAAGFSAKELKDAGFNAKELKDGGFSAQDLKAAGFSAGELRQAGFSAADLKNAGFSAADLRDAGFSAEELANAGFTADELKAAGFTEGELARAGIISPTTAASGASANGLTATSTTPTSSSTAAFGTVPSVAVDPGVEALERLQKRQAEQLSLQERQERIAAMQQAMSQQAGDLFASWSPPPTQDFVQGQLDKEKDANGAAGQSSVTTTTSTAQMSAGAPIIKAGAIMFAVLETALDSDEPSPILATIVEGPYKGARLVGNFQRTHKKVVVSFNLINIPSYAQSIPINAVAIDPDTARTALADNVNSHYLLRYGTLFGSSFIEGLAKATEESGSTTNVTFGITTTSTPVLDAKDKLIVAGGQVGKRFAQTMSSIFHTPPTVKVNAGGGIGILFMTDVAINAPTAAVASVSAPVVTAAATPPAASAAGPVTPPTAAPSETTLSANQAAAAAASAAAAAVTSLLPQTANEVPAR